MVFHMEIKKVYFIKKIIINNSLAINNHNLHLCLLKMVYFINILSPYLQKFQEVHNYSLSYHKFLVQKNFNYILFHKPNH